VNPYYLPQIPPRPSDLSISGIPNLSVEKSPLVFHFMQEDFEQRTSWYQQSDLPICQIPPKLSFIGILDQCDGRLTIRSTQVFRRTKFILYSEDKEVSSDCSQVYKGLS
jgi:hypothetical protein